MTDPTSDQSAGVGPTGGEPPEPATADQTVTDVDHNETLRNIVGRAVADLDIDDEESVFADQATREIVREAYRTVTRDRTVESDADAAAIIEAAISELSGTAMTLDHTGPVTVDPVDAAVYTFSRTRGEDAFEGVTLPAPLVDPVAQGAAHCADEEYADAAAAFSLPSDHEDDAVAITAHVLAGLARHWNGDDDTAIDHVKAALQRDMDAWTPLLVGVAAGSDLPQRFRDGDHDVVAYVRWTTRQPSEECTVTARWRPDTASEWRPLAGRKCAPLSRLTAESQLRFTLDGTIPDFPELMGYYVTLGVVDNRAEIPEARSADRILTTGPVNDHVTEQLSLDR
jgi:hypothetical protein